MLHLVGYILEYTTYSISMGSLILCMILKIILIEKICLLTVTSFMFTECKPRWLGILNFMGRVSIDSKARLLLWFHIFSYICRCTKSFYMCFTWQNCWQKLRDYLWHLISCPFCFPLHSYSGHLLLCSLYVSKLLKSSYFMFCQRWSGLAVFIHLLAYLFSSNYALA